MTDSKGKILVIDDSKTVLITTSHALSKAGYEVVMLESAVGAVSELRYHQPDLVLLDLSMPELNGEELLEIISRFGLLTNTTVLLFSDQGEDTLRAVVERTGAAGYIKKSTPHDTVCRVNDWMDYRWPL